MNEIVLALMFGGLLITLGFWGMYAIIKAAVRDGILEAQEKLKPLRVTEYVSNAELIKEINKA